MKRVFVSLVLLGLSVAFSYGQTPGWTLDKVHSSVQFVAQHMVVSHVTGRFADFDISLVSSKDDFSDASVTATLKVESLTTDNPKRDGHLKSDDFFNAAKYPTITFKSTSFEKVSENKYAITGNLTIRDVTRPVTFDADYQGSVKAYGKTISAWKAVTTIDRFDYNLKWNQTLEAGGLIVGKNVDIVLNLEFDK